MSQATVSMVLNKKYNVSFSKEVIQNVEQAAEELGYVLPKRKVQREERREKLLGRDQSEPDESVLCHASPGN